LGQNYSALRVARASRVWYSTINAEEEEGDEDVTDIVGDVRGDKET